MPEQSQEPTSPLDLRAEIKASADKIPSELEAALKAAENLYLQHEDHEERALLLGIRNSINRLLGDLAECAKVKNRE